MNSIPLSGGFGNKKTFSRSRFDALDDTFKYPGNAGKVVVVNGTETGLEAVTDTSLDDHKVKTSAGDGVPDFLDGKLVAGNGIALPTSGGGNDQMTIALDANISNLNDVATSSPAVDEGLFWNGLQWVNKPVPAGSTGSAVSYYFDDSPSGIAGYQSLERLPDSGPEEVDSAVVNSGTSPVLIDEYATPAALGRTVIDAGEWNFLLYGSVDSTTGASSLLARVYSRTSGGVETLLFSVNTTEINSAGASLFDVLTVQPAFTILATDRLVVKIYAVTTSAGNRTISFYHNGTTHYSHFDTPLATLHNDLSGIQGGTGGEYYHVTAAEKPLITTHASRHAVGGADALTVATPGASAVGDSATEGTATSFSRSDHKHGREAFGSPVASAPSDTAANGTATTLARSDHRHARESVASLSMLTRQMFYTPDALNNPVNAGWAVNLLAPVVIDSSYIALLCRAFDDDSEEGAGISNLYIPAGATNIIMEVIGRPTSTENGTTVKLRVYGKDLGNGTALGAWSAAQEWGDLTMQNDQYFRNYTKTYTLASLGLVAGRMGSIEMTRNGTADSLGSDFNLAGLKISFS